MHNNVLFHMMRIIKKPAAYAALGVVMALIFLGVSMGFGGSSREVVIREDAPILSPATQNSSAEKPAAPQIDYARIRDVFRGKDVEKVPAREKVFALTFDGGGDAKDAQAILAVLAKHGISATFFLTGHFMETFPEEVAAIQKSGGEIANHTMDHKDLSKLSSDAVIAQIAGMEQTAKAKGVTVMPFFRFPYGAPTKDAIAIVNDRGYVSVRWTVDSLGWQGKINGHDAAFVANRVIRKAVPGGIALMHLGAAKDGSTFDADVLEQIITALTQQGYTLVPLSELFNEAIKNTAS